MLTATIDDGWGHGLDVIERVAEAAGVRVRRIGLLRTALEILDECRKQEPDLLGLTVLQFDSDDTVDAIVRGLPARTLLVAGGAAYRYDPDFAARTGTRRVARDGSGFLRFLLEYRREK
ncbi:MAG: cobalamin-dependent protein [Desulfobacterales bacterium]